MTNKCGSDGRPPLGVSGGPSTLHAMVQHGFLNEGCTTRYSWLAQFQGYKPLMYGIKPDYVRSVTKNGTSKCIAAPNLNIQLSISLDYKKHLKLHQFLWPSKWPPATSLVMIPDDPRIGQKLDPIWSMYSSTINQTSWPSCFSMENPLTFWMKIIDFTPIRWWNPTGKMLGTSSHSSVG